MGPVWPDPSTARTERMTALPQSCTVLRRPSTAPWKRSTARHQSCTVLSRSCTALRRPMTALLGRSTAPQQSCTVLRQSCTALPHPVTGLPLGSTVWRRTCHGLKESCPRFWPHGKGWRRGRQGCKKPAPRVDGHPPGCAVSRCNSRYIRCREFFIGKRQERSNYIFRQNSRATSPNGPPGVARSWTSTSPTTHTYPVACQNRREEKGSKEKKELRNSGNRVPRCFEWNGLRR